MTLNAYYISALCDGGENIFVPYYQNKRRDLAIPLVKITKDMRLTQHGVVAGINLF